MKTQEKDEKTSLSFFCFLILKHLSWKQFSKLKILDEKLIAE